jgi:hypothetical protein
MDVPRQAQAHLLRLARGYPVVAINGPRQAGKTTLARVAFPQHGYVTLEDEDERAFAARDPRAFLKRWSGGVVIDEVQRVPSLCSFLQGIVDARRDMGRWVLTGSQQFGRMSGITQSLAGRVGRLELLPFGMYELRAAGRLPESLDEVLLRGLYPALYAREVRPRDWYADYVATYVERDVRQLTNIGDLSVFRRFLSLCAARTGQLLNLSSLATDCGVSQPTAKAWLSVLEASWLVFLLRPHHANFGKRLVKMPRLYFHDTGLAAWLVEVREIEQMRVHPMRGALFETLVVNEILKARTGRGDRGGLWFWRDHVGHEVDVVIEGAEGLVPVEIKSGATLADDFFDGLRWFAAQAGRQAARAHLVHGGESSHARGDVDVHGWRDV